MDTEIKNAVISSASLYLNSILSFSLAIECNGSIIHFGDIALDGPVPEKDRLKREYSRTPSLLAGIVIAKLLDTVGIEQWEKLPGTYLRIQLNRQTEKIIAIGNPLKEKWFSIKDALEMLSYAKEAEKDLCLQSLTETFIRTPKQEIFDAIALISYLIECDKKGEQA